MRTQIIRAISALLLLIGTTAFCASCGGSTSKSPGSTPGTGPASSGGGGNNTGMALELPAGFSISTFADGLDSPRVPAFDAGGNLLVSTPGSGQVIALPDRNSDGVADEQVVVADNLNDPHGLAFLPGDPTKLYIAETDQVAVYDYDDGTLRAGNKRKIVDLPAGGGHHTRTIMFLPGGPDRLLIAVGSSCNVCIEDDWRRAKILVANTDGSDLKPFASGLRNSVFMALHPVTGQVWATENGRDLLGDNLPPDEINIIEEGKDYGWPTCYGKNVHDTDFDKNVYVRDPCEGKTPSYIDLQAHSAPLGLAFVDSGSWPTSYGGDLLVAFHGSWNRSVPTGYKVVRIKLNEKGAYQGIEDFISGWLRPDGSVVGRPVGITLSSNGTAYITDDQAGLVYRVTPP
jgi:glucose/arabinose dehydrogenase